MKRFLLFLVGGICLTTAISGAVDTDSLGFVSPVDHQIRLTGNFMELRPNHFHAGIDIKSSKGVVGDNIRSVQSGYISRIKIQSGGYGNVLYIDHPSGHTSVYAHLHEFMDEVDQFVTDTQYDIESWAVDIYLPDSLIRIEKGQIIGTMGNSGRSFGPHLHFEIRDTELEKPLNPELLGIGPADTSPPVLESLHLHSLSSEGDITEKEVRYFKKGHQDYHLHEEVITVDSDRVGIGLQMFDRMDGSWNKNGIYGFQLKVDGKVHFSWKADGFTFDETRFINGFWDYERLKRHGQKVYLMYKTQCNPFSFYGKGDGIIELGENAKKIEVIIIDAKKNKSFLDFAIKSGKKKKPVAHEIVDCDSVLDASLDFFRVTLEEQTLFSPTELQLSEGKNMILGQECPYVTIGNTSIAANGYYSISCPIPSGYNEKWTLVSTDSKGRFLHFGGDTLGGRFLAKVDVFGTFYLSKDTEPPTVKPVILSSSLKKPWKLTIKDNLIADGKTNELSYRATVNGQWLRFEYDKKNDLLVFDDWERLPERPFDLKMLVTDHCGNVSEYTRTIE